MLRINTISGHERMSTRELLEIISEAVARGEHNFHINASGQHDIGGPLWSPDGLPLHFEVINPGQRVGGMCLAGTKVVVCGSAPADTGWLNSGGDIIVKGDSGDTTGHCAAGGKIYIDGRCGTRAGALMKHDPKTSPPELWVLKNVGSFSFEFMGGGYAIICGYDCLTMPSVLGARSCIGMVGGTIYFRGNIPELPPDVEVVGLAGEDIEFLHKGLNEFLTAIEKPQLHRELTIWKHWNKIIPALQPISSGSLSISEFKNREWFKDGVFGAGSDHNSFTSLVPTGNFRLREPIWARPDKCVDCRQCVLNCPRHAIKRRANGTIAVYKVRGEACIGCGICLTVCKEKVWELTPALNSLVPENE